MKDRDFVTTFSAVLFGLVILSILIVTAANLAANALPDANKEMVDGDELINEKVMALTERLKPIGQVNTDPSMVLAAADTGADDAMPIGEKTYNAACMACHAAGVAGAPKLGDKAVWAARLEKGMETLYANAINGVNAMPAKGGNPALSDDDVKAAVDHMLEAVK